MKYYLRIESVNLKNFLADSHDLSTIRGGSLLLLDLVEKLPAAFENPKFECLSTGASIGLFAFEADSEVNAADVRDEIEHYLNGHTQAKYATFVVDVCQQEPSQFVLNREQLLAMNRWRQLRQPSLAVPPTNENENHLQACEVDLVSPAVTRIEGQENRWEFVSESVKERRTFGREQKKKFYSLNATPSNGTSFDGEFTLDLDQLTNRQMIPGIHRNDPLKNTHHKMAVIYLDGNGFSKIQRKFVTDAESQKKWDQAIKGKRLQVLGDLLIRMQADTHWQCKDKKDNEKKTRLRIETLKWGGDDILWVVPAWKAWETLSFFFEQSKKWEFNGDPLTHAAGLVICHHNAPIHRITALAWRLAELAKVDRSKSLFAYEVLESFDHIGRDLDEYRKEYCPLSAQPQELILDGTAMNSVAQSFSIVKDSLARRQLHRLLRHLRKPDRQPEEYQTILNQMVKPLDEEGKKALEELKKAFGTTDTFWFHLAAWWDFLPINRRGIA